MLRGKRFAVVGVRIVVGGVACSSRIGFLLKALLLEAAGCSSQVGRSP